MKFLQPQRIKKLFVNILFVLIELFSPFPLYFEPFDLIETTQAQLKYANKSNLNSECQYHIGQGGFLGKKSFFGRTLQYKAGRVFGQDWDIVWQGRNFLGPFRAQGGFFGRAGIL